MFPTGLINGCDTSPAGARSISIPVPLAGSRSGYAWISPVPRLPLYPHALISGPGGVAHTRLIACETTAFRGLQLVGFPPPRGVILSDHHSTYFGIQYTTCGLATLGFRHPLTEVALGFTTRLLAKLWLGGIRSPLLTHWVTSVNFRSSHSFPRLWIYLGTSKRRLAPIHLNSTTMLDGAPVFSSFGCPPGPRRSQATHGFG